MHDGTAAVDMTVHDGTLYVHVAPASNIADIHRMNTLLYRVATALVRLGSRPDKLSFRRCDGTLYLGRITFVGTVVSVYPTRWLAEQMAAACRYPMPVMAISELELA